MIDKPFEELVHAFAAKTPTPGGGAAAAMSASLGIALLLMTLRFTKGKKAAAGHEAALEEAEKTLDAYLLRMLPMSERDSAAFALVSNAYALPKGTEAEVAVRTRAIDESMLGAIVVPEETLFMVRDVLRAVAGVAECVGRNIISDLGTGTQLLAAGAESAFLNVRVNAGFLNDRERASRAMDSNSVVMTDIREFHRAIVARVDAALN